MSAIKKIDKKIIIGKTASLFLFLFFFAGFFYALFPSAQIARAGQSQARSMQLNLIVGTEFTISSSSPTLSLSGTINGISGGIATGTASFTISNASQNGFYMQVSANQSPALELNGTGTANYNSFYDYIPTVIGTPDYNYSAPSPGSSTFGFALAADADASAVQLFRNSSNLCNQSNGVTSGDNCWYGFSTSPLTVVNDSTFTGGNTTETLAFRAQRTSSTTSALESGNYTATIIVTAYSN